MKKFYVSVLLLFAVGTTYAQEELSKEEKARREKNIEAANPFKKFGYKAKVATLSKGKYLEVHDLDSIVIIGSVRFHVDRKEIVGFVQQDSSMYARPIGDMPSRWLSPDPLSEEFTSWSPYNYCYDNPILFVDPDGMAASPIYGLDGKYLGNDAEGFTGEVIFMEEKTFNTLAVGGTDMNGTTNISHETALSNGQTLGQVMGSNPEMDFSQSEMNMVNNAITDIVSKAGGMEYSISDLKNGATSTYYAQPTTNENDGNSYFTLASNEGRPYKITRPDSPAIMTDNIMTFNLTSSSWSGSDFTVNNIQNAASHEGNGHFVHGVTGEGKGHAKAYEMQMKHSSWNGATKNWKATIQGAYQLVKQGKL